MAVDTEDDTVLEFLAVSERGHGKLVDGHTLHGDVRHGGPIGVAGL